jgi:hypothetical protein
MNAKILTYDEGGTETAPSRALEAHIVWNERPEILSLEIELEPGKYIGVQIPVSEIESGIAASLSHRRRI